MTPTSVADVQTRRTLKRSGSTSSVGSWGSQRSGTPQLERRGSSGSMSERTFREPSPGPSRPVPSAADAPPVPAIPQHIRTESHRRASSMEAPPQRVASPVNRNPAGRGSSLGPQGSAVAAARRSDQRSSLASVSELTSVEQRRGSVNFSYPTDSRPGSPTQKNRLTSLSPSRILTRANPPARINTPDNQSLVYDPNTRSFLPAVTVHSIQQNINDVANQPVKKKKKAPPGNAQGTYLTEASVGGRPKGTAVDALRAAEKQQSQQPIQPIQQEPTLAPQPQQKAQPEPQQLKVTRVESIFDSAPEVAKPVEQAASVPRKTKKVVASDYSSGDEGPKSSDNESDIGAYGARKAQSLGKKPSIVREDPEREEKEDDTPQRAKPALTVNKTRVEDRSISPSPLPRSKAGKLHRQDSLPQHAPVVQQTPRSVSQPPASVAHIEPVTEPTPLAKNGSIRGARVSSLSPGRVAHFAATPDQLTVKHQPPPRSISPIKSALKHSNSRNSSPMPANVSETSGSPSGVDEQPIPRKKAVRVSFDERNVIVGDAAPVVTSDSPIAPSPQVSKRPWYSIGRGKKKESTVSTDDEEDEIMKPRPALPSFGSVRERKVRTEVEERPLVKPTDPSEHKVAKAPVLPSPVAEVNESPLGQSNDHIVGAILAQDSQNRNEANISKSREPLPPQVTSVEGTGYHSDTDSDVSTGDTSTPGTVATEPEVVKAPEAVEETTPAALPAASTSTPLAPTHLEDKTANDSDTDDTPTPTQEITSPPVPQIAISLPTPTEESEKKEDYLDIPGSWNDTTSDSDYEGPEQVGRDEIASTPAVAGIAEPKPSVTFDPLPQVEAQRILNSTLHELPEESESEVFSDAAEELTDSDHEGFQSLNAAVDSPITTVASKLPEPPESPTVKIARQKLEQEENAKANGDWNQAQSYWSSLSADKKKQLELAALRDADSSDTEVEVKPAPKPKKKKKVVRPDPPQENVSSERSYMIKPGSKAGAEEFTPMRKSMRFEPPAPLNVDSVIVRRSMRGQQQGSMRDSMRGSNERSTMQTRNRPVSLPVAPRNEPVAGKHSRNLSSASAAAATNPSRQPAQPVLRRKKSTDSESSFRRSRPSGERSMMRTMRTTNNQPQAAMSSKNSVRSISPTDSVARRPFSGFASQQQNDTSSMRMSMRGNAGPAPTMRGSAGRAKSPSGSSMKLSFGFGNKSAKPQKAAKESRSRFADSSDEEDARPTFRSRFHDSSDESDGDLPASRPNALGRTLRSSALAPAPAPSEPPAYTPLRGIPRRTDTVDLDSSDLPDSDDEKSTPGQVKLSKKRLTNGTSSQGVNLASGSLRRSGSGRETMAATSTSNAPPLSGSTRPPQKRRGSFMSILRRKKDDTSKVRKSDAESPARRDTPLERSKSDLQALKHENVKTPPHSPRLQKRNPLSRENSAVPSSPVSPSQGQARFEGLTSTNAPIITTSNNNDGRPYTANAAEDKEMGLGSSNGVTKPSVGTRRYTSDALGGMSGGVTTVGITGGVGGGEGKKKKKFGSLRRMFGLHD